MRQTSILGYGGSLRGLIVHRRRTRGTGDFMKPRTVGIRSVPDFKKKEMLRNLSKAGLLTSTITCSAGGFRPSSSPGIFRRAGADQMVVDRETTRKGRNQACWMERRYVDRKMVGAFSILIFFLILIFGLFFFLALGFREVQVNCMYGGG